MLVVNGFAHPVPGRVGLSFRDVPRLRLDARGDDWRPRRRDEMVMGIVVHTRMGMTVKVVQGAGRNLGWDEDVAARWTKDERKASAHLAVDADGSYCCFTDLAKTAAYHAGHVNGITVGIEMYQGADGTVYQETLEATADILDVLTRIFGVQRQFPVETGICRRLANHVDRDPYTYIRGANRGRDFSGVYGHRNVTRNRGAGDPGDDIFAVLRARGYEGYRIDEGQDVAAWSKRQAELGLPERDIDGVPEAHTRRLIALAHRNPTGLWVPRPGDDDYTDGPAE